MTSAQQNQVRAQQGAAALQSPQAQAVRVPEAGSEQFVLTLSCPDRRGIVHAVSSFLFMTGCNIEDSQQFGDRDTGLFFMRVHFSAGGSTGSPTETPSGAPAGAVPGADAPVAAQASGPVATGDTPTGTGGAPTGTGGGAGTPDGGPGRTWSPDSAMTLEKLRASFAAVGDSFRMDWQLHRAEQRMRVLLMVSRFGHCLNDLLFRARIGALPVEVAAVVSNHTDFAELAASFDIPFHHIPVTRDTKPEAEERLLRLVREEEVELVVLARYMQVLSDDLCKALPGRIINIHHSFLPSFKGAKPYHQAHARGVKLIGATAHYVTADLDEGPIIEQEVERVGHDVTPEQLVAVGRDVECQALARAVKWHSEHRVLLNGHRTVVFA